MRKSWNGSGDVLGNADRERVDGAEFLRDMTMMQ